MRYLLFILPFCLSAQTEQEIMQGFQERTYEVIDWREFGNTAPWQTWRHSFREAIQIDVHVNKEEMDVLMADRHIAYRDLILFYNTENYDALEIVQRGYKCSVRSAANPRPWRDFWKLELYQDSWLDWNEQNPYHGWHWGVIAGDRVGFAVKEIGAQKWHLSFAMLMEFIGPWFDNPGVKDGEIYPLPKLIERKEF